MINVRSVVKWHHLSGALLCELVQLVLIALGAIALGVIINVARPHPLGRNYKDPASRLVARSQDKGPAIVLIGFDEMRANIGDAEKLIVDARPAIFFRFGYIPTAVNLPRDEFEKYLPQVRERLGDSLIRQTVIYCAGGDCEDSTLVAERLMAVGVKAIAIYQGGWDEWSAKASSP